MCDQCERHGLGGEPTWTEAILGGLAVALLAAIAVGLVGKLLGAW